MENPAMSLNSFISFHFIDLYWTDLFGYLVAGLDGVGVFELGQEEEIVLDISVINSYESAYEAGLYISHPSSLSFIGRVSNEANQLLCNTFNNTMVECMLGNPFKHGFVTC